MFLDILRHFCVFRVFLGTSGCFWVFLGILGILPTFFGQTLSSFILDRRYEVLYWTDVIKFTKFILDKSYKVLVCSYVV